MGKKKPTAKKPVPPLKRKRPQQGQLPGTADKHDAKLTALVLAYVEARDHRMELTQAETKAQQALLAAMAERKIAVYRDKDNELLVEVVPEKIKVKVKHWDIEKGQATKGLPPEQPAEDATTAPPEGDEGEQPASEPAAEATGT